MVNNYNLIAVLFWPVAVPIIVFIVMYFIWYMKGKDPKGKGVIVPQYEILDDLTPLEVGGVVDEYISNKNMSAEIVYLASKGYIKIEKIKRRKLFLLFPRRDYEFTLMKDPNSLMNDFDKQIISTMFGGYDNIGKVVKMSKSIGFLAMMAPEIQSMVISSLIKRGYFSNVARRVNFEIIPRILDYLYEKFENRKRIKYYANRSYIFFWMLALSIIMLMILLIELRDGINVLTVGHYWIFSIITSIIIWLFFRYHMSAKTTKGVQAKEYLLGLKMYLKIAEKDRLSFHNAPERKPQIFEHLLPYAMALGVEKVWAKEYIDQLNTVPDWLVIGMMNSGSGSFISEISNFNSYFRQQVRINFPLPLPISIIGVAGGGGGGGGGGSW